MINKGEILTEGGGDDVGDEGAGPTEGRVPGGATLGVRRALSD